MRLCEEPWITHQPPSVQSQGTCLAFTQGTASDETGITQVSWLNAQNEPVPTNNVNTIFPCLTPEVLLLLLGCDSASLNSLVNNSFPCALFGLYTTIRCKPWLEAHTGVDTDYTAYITFLFECTFLAPFAPLTRWKTSRLVAVFILTTVALRLIQGSSYYNVDAA